MRVGRKVNIEKKKGEWKYLGEDNILLFKNNIYLILKNTHTHRKKKNYINTDFF